MRWIHLFAIAVFLLPRAEALDTLKPTAGGEVTGLFMGYENGSFSLLDSNQKTEKKLVAATFRLTLDPPRDVTVYPRAGKPETLQMAAYEKGQFQFKVNGQASARPLSLVKRIEVPFSAQGNVDDLTAAAVHKDGAGELPALNELAVSGKVTIVHFHYPKSVASMRQGALAARLARDSGGDVALHKIEIPDWTSPALARYDLKSLPQFWYYDAKGALVTKLTERFTDEDLTSALQSARHR